MLRYVTTVTLFGAALLAQAPVFTSSAVERLSWRNLGPANPMGRITDIAIHPDRQNTWFVGTAGGGVFCTRNAGTTFENVFAGNRSASIGDVAIAPADPDIVWIGTGEENARNSVQWGDGVYKSTDGGKTFTHMGLEQTFQIGHIEIHPKNPDIVYVAALGQLWGTNAERGVFRTRDGGETWERVLYVDDRTGCVDVRVHPDEPDTVFACLYERKRDRFDGNDPVVRFGEHSGLYKSIDGGENWKQLTQGLPTCRWGRSGIDIFAQKPDTMFAIIETERSGWQKGDRKDRLASDPPDDDEGQGRRGGRFAGRGGRGSADMGIGREGRESRGKANGAILAEVREEGAAAKAGLEPGDRIVAIDGERVESYADLVEIVRDSRAEQVLKVEYVRGGEHHTVEVTLQARVNPMMRMAGRPNGPYSGRLFGQLANKQKYQGELGYETGGVFRSDDRGETWRRLNSLTERPFYYSVIRVDPRTTDNLYCVGTTLWASRDGGETFAGINRGIHVDFHAIWIDPDDSEHLVAGCDGGLNETRDGGRSWQVHHGFSAAQYYDCAVDNALPYNVIGGLQDNGTWVVPSRTSYRDGITTADCFKIWGGDGFGAQVDPLEPHIVFATSQNGSAGVYDLESGAQVRLTRERPSDGVRPRFNWDAPFLLSPHNRLTLYHAGNHVYRGERHSHLDNTRSRPGLEPMHNARRLRMRCISPHLGATERGTATAIAESPLVQGLLYVGTDDGALWRSDDGGRQWQRIDANLPIDEGLYISDIVPSHFKDDRVYLTLDGHRSNDFRTHVLVSEDRGAKWYDIGETLPGTEVCYAFAEDPRNEELLFLGTETGCWVSLDRGYNWLSFRYGMPTASVRELVIQDRDSDLVAATHGRGLWVVDIEPLRQLRDAIADADAHLFEVEPAYQWRMASRGFQGHKHFKAENPPYGVTFYLWLKAAPEKPPELTIHDVTGKRLTAVKGEAVAGLQAIRWDTRLGRELAAPGVYAVRLSGHEGVAARAFELRPDPKFAGTNPTVQSASR